MIPSLTEVWTSCHFFLLLRGEQTKCNRSKDLSIIGEAGNTAQVIPKFIVKKPEKHMKHFGFLVWDAQQAKA